MKSVRFVLLLGVAALIAVGLSAVKADGDVDDTEVLVVTEDNFEDAITDHETLLLEFYAPWCGHCKRLAPEWGKAAAQLVGNPEPVKLAKCDATEHGALAQRFGVTGYPTIKVFRNGEVSDYKGPRDAPGIVNYAKKSAGPSAKPVSSQADLDKFLNDKGTPYHIVGFFSDAKSKLAASFSLTANKLRDDHIFIRTSSADLLKAYDVEGEAIIAFKKYDDKQTKYDGSTKTKDLQAWIEKNSVPVVGHFTATTQGIYAKRGLPVLKVYVDAVHMDGPNYRHTRYFINRVKKVAEEHSGELVVALAEKAEYQADITELGAADAKVTVAVQDTDGSKYLMKAKFGKDTVAQFAKDFLAGNVEKHVKSEEPPADNDGPVTVVTGKTFDDIVNDPEADVLIEFYAPWCGHCKKLAPIYEKLGKAFKSTNTVRIAKIDATANDYPKNFPVSGYPSLFFVPARKGAEPVKYSGGRDLDDLKSYVKKNAVKPIKKNKKKRKKGKKSKK